MQRLHLILIIFLISCTLLQAQTIKWHSVTDLSKAISTLDAPVYIYIHAPGEPFGKAFEERTLQDPEVISLLNANFYCVKFNGTTDKNTYTLQGKEYGPGEGSHALAATLMVRGPGFPSQVFLDQRWDAEDKKSSTDIVEHQGGLIKPEDFLKLLSAVLEHRKDLQENLTEGIGNLVLGIVKNPYFCDNIDGIVGTMPGAFEDLKGEYTGLPGAFGMEGVDAWAAKLNLSGALGIGEIEHLDKSSEVLTYPLAYAAKRGFEKKAFHDALTALKECMRDANDVSWTVSENEFSASGSWSDAANYYKVLLEIDDSFYFGDCLQLSFVVDRDKK